MMRCVPQRPRGFSAIEMLLVVALVGIISSLVFVSVGRFGASRALDAGAKEVLSVLEDARSRATASVGGMAYGVRFEAQSVTLFRGGAYVPGAPDNIVLTLSSRVTIADISLEGGATEVVFDRLTGKANVSGTVTVALAADASATRVIRIEASGLSSISLLPAAEFLSVREIRYG